MVLVPVFNDWDTLEKLLPSLDEVLSEHGLEADLLIVDDGSTAPVGQGFPGRAFASLRGVGVLRLRRNLGHQRAIAIGLAYVHERALCQAVVVMDADGEDDPADVPRLLDKCRANHGEKIIFAERARRSESWSFRFFYALYKLSHYLLTGRAIRVGNFSVVPMPCLSSLVAVSEIWNHYAAGVFQSRQPFDTVLTRRAKRLGGRSTMSFISLVTHGLSAISVYGNTVGVRLLVAATAVILLALVGLGGVVAVRLLTDLAVPGWATTAAGLLLVIILHGVMFAFAFTFIILSNRQGANFLPLRDYHYFVHHYRAVRQGPSKWSARPDAPPTPETAPLRGPSVGHPR